MTPPRIEKFPPVPWYGKLAFHVLPLQRGPVMRNLRRIFGDTLSNDQLVALAQACYGHFVRFVIEYLRMMFMSAEAKKKLIRVENMEAVVKAHEKGKGVLLLAGHFGNWEVSTIAGISQFTQYKGLFHFVRRPLKPKWFNDLITHRFRRAGFGTLAKRGSLDSLLDLLAEQAIVVFVFDQHAGARDGVLVNFMGQPAHTFKSLAIIALSTGAPVIPAASWREPDGTHVLRFGEPLPHFDSEDTNEAIRRNTQTYNDAIEKIVLRHPEQWIWMHRRWKT
ncbi:MAG TPA: lysophospholipid acyltransferase family protein [Chthoniobacteraceae bacterium]|nr:lysophospholipid acyltransferase family protein [Chthoniobacteraceae bacterium]